MMVKKIFIPILISTLVLIVFFIFSRTFSEQSLFYLGLPFVVLTFFSALCMGHFKFEVKCKSNLLPEIAIGLLTISCILSIFLIPAYDGSYLEWGMIPLFNWVRYIASLLLTTFLPGLFILKIIFCNKPLGKIALIVLSYILSISITFSIGYILLITSDIISSLSVYLVALLNLVLMVFFYAKKSKSPIERFDVRYDLVEIGVIFSLCAVSFIESLYIISNTLPLLQGDMWRHLSQALQFSKGFPVYEGMMLPGYPYLFHVYNATLFQLAGVPPSVAFQALFTLSFIGVLSFFIFVKEWLSVRRLYLVAASLVPLLGFGSLYAIFLATSNQTISLPSVIAQSISKTYDLCDVMIIGPLTVNVVPLLFISLPSLFAFLFLLKKEMNNRAKCFLFSIIVFMSFLGHIDASFFMGIFVFLYAVLFKEENIKPVALGGIMGLIFAGFIDLIAPVQVYLWSFNYVPTSTTFTFFISITLFAVSAIIPIIRTHINLKKLTFRNITLLINKRIILLVTLIIIGFYFFSLIVWLYVLPYYEVTVFGHYDFTPFFIWPVRFGAVGLLFILCVWFYLGDVIKNKKFVFFLSLSAIGFLLEQFSNYYPLYPAYRFGTITLIGLIPLSSYFIVKSIESLRGKRKLLLSLLMVLILLPSMLSLSLYAYSTANLKPNISSYEADALKFIESHLSSNSSVVTFTDDSESKLSTFAGVNQLQILRTWDYLIKDNPNLASLLYMLGTSNAKYAYLSASDFGSVNESGTLFSQLLNYSAVAYRNPDVTVYELPKILPPVRQGNTVIVNPLKPDQPILGKALSAKEFLIQSTPSFLGADYTVLSIPIEKNVTKEPIQYLQNSTSWFTTEGVGNIATNSDDPSVTLSINSIRPDENRYFAISCKFNGNFAQLENLEIPLFVSENVQGQLKIILRDNNNNWACWIVTDFSRNQWFSQLIPIGKATLESPLPLNLSEICRIDIGFQNFDSDLLNLFKIGKIKNISTSYYLPLEEYAEIKNSKTIIFSEDPEFDVTALLSMDKDILIFSGNDSGFFHNILNLTSNRNQYCNGLGKPYEITFEQTKVPEVLSSDNNVICTSNYELNGRPVAPLTLFRREGLGSITYVSLSNSFTIEPYTLKCLIESILTKTPVLSDLLENVPSVTKHPLGSYNTIEGESVLQGDITVVSDNMFLIDPIATSRIEILYKGSLVIFENVTIDKIEFYGPVTFKIENALMNMTANGSDYSEMACNTKDGFYSFLSNGVSLTLTNSSGTYTLHSKEAKVDFNTDSFVRLLSRYSSFNIKGVTQFSSARIQYSNPYIPLGGKVRENLIIQGEVSFSIKYSDRNWMLLDNFAYSGGLNSYMPPRNTLELNWVNMFVSPNALIIYTVVTLSLVFILMKNKKVD